MSPRLFILSFCCALAFAQNPGRVTLPGHLHPGVVAANDRGRVDASLRLQHVSIMLQSTPAQQADLTAFLARQQDPGSPDYHRWLTPEQYADRFGASKQDVATVVAWLTAQHMEAIEVARGRTSISFTGNVRQIESAFGTEIHRYNLNGEEHFANAAEPSLPANIAGLISAIHGLNDFRMKPHAHSKGPLPAAAYTSGSSGNISVAPDDLATIYDITPLLNAGVNGAGLSIAIAGQTDIVLSDIASYRSFFNLPAMAPQIVTVPNTKDPGISSGDLTEADLDIEISGAIARNANIIYVNSDDVFTSAYYAINQNLAPVLSVSYGSCEASWQSSDLNTMRTMAQQANAQGITWIAASGDNGAADCYMTSGIRGSAGAALAVDAPASVPEVTGLGGTEFNEGSATYWATANNANHASALSYIPEMVWNDSAIDGSPASSGGGASTFYPKPTWQTGTGVPADAMRDVPDLSLASSDAHEPILFYSSDGADGGALQAVGGTSCAAPAFAGMTALLNHYLVANGYQKTAGLGNINPRLYALAASGGVFHDITVGNNTVNGCQGVRACTAGIVGFNATPAYDQATGLGSVDLFNLATAWPQTLLASPKGTVTLTLTFPVTTLLSTDAVTLTALATPSSTGAPTGTVTFYAAGVSLGSAPLAARAATISVQASRLPLGLVSISADYSGDANYAAAAASASLTVNSSTTMMIQSVVNAASFRQAFSPGAIVAIFGTLLAGSTQSAASVPLPTTLGGVTVTVNGTPAPLYFVSPGQINLQIPYSLNPGVTAAVAVTFNGQTATSQIPIATASPGIFTDSTGAPAAAPTARPGQTIALYVTGAGAVSPTVVAGSTPSANSIPKPSQPVTISVGGITASTSYAYIGVPAWAVGLIQINFTVPATAPLGVQPVLVMINGTTSAAANILITN